MKPPFPNGYTLVEALAAMSVMLVVSSLSLMLLTSMAKLADLPGNHQKQFGILQVRQELALAADVYLEGETIHYQLDTRNFTLKIHKDRLVKEPGYEIFCTSLQEGKLYEKNGRIYLETNHSQIQLA